jgi:formylglycine-generating enzyme required for sulfatase activity
MVKVYLFVVFTGLMAGLAVWINQDHPTSQWRFSTRILAHGRSQVQSLLSATREQALKPGHVFRDCASECPEMIIIPAGTFLMGSRQAFEQPQHKVVIAAPFAISEFETTFAEWDACAAHGDCDSHIEDGSFGRGRQPVINVTWNDAERYVAWLAKITGKPYRLPSEAEYEYAARAGTQTLYPWGDALGKNNANCNGCGSRWDDLQTAPVGSFAPNRFGLYDMAGNVYEWLEDCLHAGYGDAPANGSPWIADGSCNGRMIRGGSWADDPSDLRSASRTWSAATIRRNFIGFRVARSLDAH